MKVFQHQLRTRAEALNLSLAEIGRRAGVSERRIGHYASGRSEPDLRTLISIAEVLGTTPDGLLMGDDAGPTDAEPARDQAVTSIHSACAALNLAGLRLMAGIAGTLAEEPSLSRRATPDDAGPDVARGH